MIILQSQISEIDLDTLSLDLSAKFIETPYVCLDILTLSLSLPVSPSLQIVDLDILTLVLSPTIIPAAVPVVVSLSTLDMVFVVKSTGFVQETGYVIKDLLLVLLAGGSAPVTPGRFTDCDFMDVIDAFRAGDAQPTIPEDESCMMSDLLNALDIGNPVPYKVPVIGSWFGELEWPPYVPSVSKSLFRFLGSMPNETLQISTDRGSTWTNHPKAKMDATPAPVGTNPIAVTYLGEGVIIFADSVPGIFYRATNYGLAWQRIDYSGVITKAINRISVDKESGVVFASAGVATWGRTTPEYLYKSLTRGASWNLVYTLTGTNARFIGPVTFLPNGSLLVVMEPAEGGVDIRKSTDGGETWTTKYHVDYFLTAPIIYMEDGKLLFANAGYWAYEQRYVITKSDDYGETWSEEVATGLLGYNYQGVYLGSGVVLLNAHFVGLVYRSTDYGVTWSSVSISSYNAPVTLFNYGSGVVVAKLSGSYSIITYAVSTDYGATWTTLDNIPWDENQYAQQEIYISG